MSRQIGSKNKEQLMPELAMNEVERLKYIAALIIELMESEMAPKEARYAAFEK